VQWETRQRAEVAEVVGCSAVRRARLVAADGECGAIARLVEGWELS
jgi:hypothetical protein